MDTERYRGKYAEEYVGFTIESEEGQPVSSPSGPVIRRRFAVRQDGKSVFGGEVLVPYWGNGNFPGEGPDKAQELAFERGLEEVHDKIASGEYKANVSWFTWTWNTDTNRFDEKEGNLPGAKG